MVFFPNTATGITAYADTRADGGPFQMLSEARAVAFAKRTKSHLNDVNKLTETVTGSDHGNMILTPGSEGVCTLSTTVSPAVRNPSSSPRLPTAIWGEHHIQDSRSWNYGPTRGGRRSRGAQFGEHDGSRVPRRVWCSRG